MSFLKNISSRIFNLTGEKLFYSYGFWSQDVASYTFSGYALNEFIVNGYRNAYVYMCIEKIADVASELPFKLVDSNGNEIEETPSVLKKPSERENTFNDFYHKTCSYLLLTGNVFIYGIKPVGFSTVEELELWNPKYVTINTDTGLDDGKVKSYTYQGKSKTMTVPAEDLLHIKYPNIVMETNWGLSPLYAAISLYESSNNMFAAGAYLHKNRGISGILSNGSADIPMMPKDQAKMQESLDQRMSGVHNFGKMFVTTANVKWQNVGMSPEDLKTLEGNLSMKRDICSIYGLDSAMFNDPENKTYANRTESEKSFYTSVIKPLTDKINRNLSSFVFTDESMIKTDFSGVAVLSRPNFELSQKLIAEIQAEIITVEEAREKLYPND